MKKHSNTTNKDSVDTETLPIEYVIYCRKSTDESSEHQKQSIPDQIKACIEYTQREWITIAKKPSNFSDFEDEISLLNEENESDIVNRRLYKETSGLFIVKEQETAKIPYIRKKWRAIISRIRKWEIGGLISYSPDRQARNMLEGGELINYVDEGLVDLKYTNFHFENTASGKMMLWIWFVFSKQYSDKLSEDVSRANKNKVAAWHGIGRWKPGYQINKEWFHEPHPVNFPLIQEAFQKKLNGETDEKITQFVNANGYRRVVKKSGDELEMNEKSIYKLWTDEFYYGIFIHGSNISNLREVNPYYQPAITEDEFYVLKSRSEDRTKRYTEVKTLDIYDEITPFEKNKLIRTVDDYSMGFMLPNPKRSFDKLKELKSKGDMTVSLKDVVELHQIHYHCGNKCSKYFGLDITADVIDKAVCKKLQEFHVGEKEFQEYHNYASIQLREIQITAQESNAKKTLEINRLKSEKTRYIEKNMALKRDVEEETIYQRKKEEFDKKITILRKDMEEIDTSERNEILEIEAFMSVLNNAEAYYKKASYVQKRKITQILFLNIIIDPQKRLHIAVKPWLENLFSCNGGPTWD